MQSAPVDELGTRLAYIDSGPPESNSYTTLVVVHGHSYTAQSFSRVIERSSNHGVRIIALNRRDYVGSTLLAPAELALLHDKNASDSHKLFLRARGLEIAHFLVWVIDELKIPEGRLALAGWSLGTVTTLAFLRHLPSFPEDIIKKLEPHLKTFFIYESACAILGYPYPDGGYHPLHDSDIPVSQRSAVFTAWLSSYFVHPYTSVTADPSSEHFLSGLILRTPTPADTADYKQPSHQNIDPVAFAASVDPLPAERSEGAYYGIVHADTLYEQLSGAFFLGPAPDFGLQLPDLRVVEIYGTRSIWTVQWGKWMLEEDIGRRGAGRPVEFACVEGGNHFWHWDDPDAFLQLVAEKCGA
ncbi:hypothetical protein M0805_003119 [Coniferiporia weirii]|nr:hypothetical protein M0805_003119 [Coniferiporia weirii]